MSLLLNNQSDFILEYNEESKGTEIDMKGFNKRLLAMARGFGKEKGPDFTQENSLHSFSRNCQLGHDLCHNTF